MLETPYYQNKEIKDTIDKVLEESARLRTQIGTGQLDKIIGSKDIATQKKYCADWEKTNLNKCKHLDPEFIESLIEAGE